jgi:hypothetical protein
MLGSLDHRLYASAWSFVRWSSSAGLLVKVMPSHDICSAKP